MGRGHEKRAGSDEVVEQRLGQGGAFGIIPVEVWESATRVPALSDDPDAPIAKLVLDPFATSFPASGTRSSNTTDKSEPANIQSESRTPDTDAATTAPLTQPIHLPTRLKDRVAEFEQRLIEQAMQVSRFRQPRAAKLLGLTYNQLRAKLRKYDLIKRYGRGSRG